MNHRLLPARFIALAAAALVSLTAHSADLTVSGAASLTNAFQELKPLFESQNPGTTVLFNFAASDALLAQIAKGAPVDVFAAADQESMDRADSQTLLTPGSRHNFVSNSLVVITPADSTSPPKQLADLKTDTFKRIALGTPSGVPAGRYAKGALEAAGLWSAVEQKAVYAQSVRQCLDYVSRGEVEAGFVYGTDAMIAKDKVKVAFSVPTQTPITYPIASIAAAPNPVAAAKFLTFVSSAPAQAVLAKYGFQKP